MNNLIQGNAVDQIYSYLSTYVSSGQEELENIFSDSSCSQMAGICRYIIDAGGKRFRPLLTLLACEAVKGDYRKALPVSVATELAHTLSIIQDDIFDQATTRRGVKPVHILWGTPTAILASDYLFLKMINAILKLRNSNAGSQKLTLDVLHVVVEAGLESVEGEYLDLRVAEKEQVTVNDCITVAEKKTSALIKASLESGALIGGGKPEEIAALKVYGRELGIAYQITDDLLDLIGAPQQLGKDTFVDIANKKMTIAVVHALQYSSQQQKERILKVLKNSKLCGENIQELRDLLEQTGSVGFAQKLAFEYADKATKALQPLEQTEAKSILEIIPSIVVSRKW